MIASVFSDNTIKILDSNNDFQELYTLGGHTNSIKSICFSSEILSISLLGVDL